MANTSDAVATKADGTVPLDVNTVSVSVSYTIVDNVVYNTVTATYHAPNPLGNFAGVDLAAGGYDGITDLVKVAEHNFAGAPGATASFKVTLKRTGETVHFYFLSKNASEVTRPDWINAPVATGTLNVYPSAPVPTGLSAFA